MSDTLNRWATRVLADMLDLPLAPQPKRRAPRRGPSRESRIILGRWRERQALVRRLMAVLARRAAVKGDDSS